MSTLAIEIEQELRSLEPETAQKFERVVRDLLLLVKTQSSGKADDLNDQDAASSLAERVLNHPAIGTWPIDKDGDAHVAALRDEWDAES